MERQQRRAVWLMRPDDQPHAAPAVAAQPVERAVVTGPRKGVRLNILALLACRLSEVRPSADERRPTSSDGCQRGASLVGAGFGQAQRLVQRLHRVVRLRR